MNNKQIRILAGILVVVVLAALYFIYGSKIQEPTAEQQNTNSTNNSPVTYKNDQYGFQFTHPASWMPAPGDRNDIFRFKTPSGYEAELLLDEFGPMDLSEPWKTKNVLTLGQERGYRDGSFHCGDGSSDGKCVAVVQYRTQQMFRKGFAFEFHISADPTAESDDPAVVIPEDVKDLDQIMGSFQFTK